jgi:HSP20 family protein
MSNFALTPFREMLTLREAMNQLFDDSFIRPSSRGAAFGLDLDVEAKKDEFIVHANVPGLKPEDLQIEIVDNTVTLRGEFKAETRNEETNYLLMERSYGAFSRTISLPTAVNSSKAEATVEQGVLTLRLPKADEAKPKTIAIKAK